jgi:hypothetical protein
MSLFAKKLFYGIALTITAIAFFGCEQPTDPPADITWTTEADGASGVTTSTKITFTFAGAVTGLTAEQITLTNGTGAAAKGAISGDGENWSLGITVETAGDLSVAIDKAGVESEAKTVTVHKQAAAPATVAYTVVADGESDTTSSTKINFTFDAAVTGLTAEQITLTNGTGTATKAALTGSGANWSLGLTVETAGDLTVAITKAGVENGAKTVTVHKQGEATPVSYTITADGASGVTSSIKIDFAFAGAVIELTAEQITLTNGTGAVTKGALTGSDTSWSLEITVETAGDLTVAITKPGVESGAKTLTVHKQGEATPDPVTYTVTADGTSGVTTSTKIDFTFAGAVAELTAEQITLTNGTGIVTRGDLTGNGANWSLEITVDSAGDITVAINKPDIENTEKEITVHKALPALTDAITLGWGAIGDGWAKGSISGEGPAQAITLSVVEEPLAYFGIRKTAEQIITVGGADEAKVTRLEDGVSHGDKTASDTDALFSVNMEDLLFDGAFGESSSDTIPTGMETRTFTLTISEDGKAPREIAVNLNITLDQDTETSIYHREGTEGAYYYVKVRDAVLTDANGDGVQYMASNLNFIAFDEGPVTDLQNALVWVDHHGETDTTGVPAGFENNTTEGYSEYRLFLKKSQKIGKFNFVGCGPEINSEKNGISIELYGAGPFGLTPTTQLREQKITLDTNYANEDFQLEQTINCAGSNGIITSYGFISLTFGGFLDLNCKYKALVLGKNITIDAEKIAFGTNSGNVWRGADAQCLIEIGPKAMLIMKAHSKLTGSTGTDAGSSKALVLVQSTGANGKFIMYGGAITDNVVNDGVVEKRSANTGVILYMDGVTNNRNFANNADRNNIYSY